MNIGEQNKDYIFLDDIRGYTPVDNDWINHKKNNLLD
jgi:N-acetylneuraminic acid mutarotase